MAILLTFLASILPCKVDGDAVHIPLYGHFIGSHIVELKVVVPIGWDYDDEVQVIINGNKTVTTTVSPFRRRCDTIAIPCDSPQLVSVAVLGKKGRKPSLFVVGLRVLK